jgi:SOS-response transcriptional repressor LexA
LALYSILSKLMTFDAASLGHVDPITLGQRIAGLRRSHGWSQRKLAEAAAVSHGYIALLELGRLSSPGTYRLDAVARALDLRTSDALLAASAAPVRVAAPVAAPASVSHATSARLPSNGASTAAAARVTAPSAAPAVTSATGAPTPRDLAALADTSNVVGNIDQLRTPAEQPLPVFRWGSCGDPRDRESPPDPDHLEFPPPGRESLVGPNGFGVMVKGDSMAGRGIVDGDVVWVNPDRPYQFGKVVLALVRDISGDSGMVVKTYARSDVGECLMSDTADGQRSPVVCQEFRVIGPVVGITSWRLPS